MKTKDTLLNEAMDLTTIADKLSDVFGKIEVLQQRAEELASDAGEEHGDAMEQVMADWETPMTEMSCVVDDIEERAAELEEEAKGLFQLTLKNDLICCGECSSTIFILTTVGKRDRLTCSACETTVGAS